jgi:hypothetical protein
MDQLDHQVDLDLSKDPIGSVRDERTAQAASGEGAGVESRGETRYRVQIVRDRT